VRALLGGRGTQLAAVHAWTLEVVQGRWAAAAWQCVQGVLRLKAPGDKSGENGESSAE